MKMKFFQAQIVTSIEERRIILLLNIIEILKKSKIFENHLIPKLIINTDLRKQDFLSAEKIIDHSCFVNKEVVRADSIQ